MYTEVHTLADANLRLERCGGTMLPKKPLGPPYSPHPHTMRDAVIPLLVPLEAATGPLQTRLGQTPQLNWRLPTKPRSFTTMDYGSVVTSTV